MPGTTALYNLHGLPQITVTTNWLANIIIGALFTFLGTLVLALRILATILRHRPLGNDDYTMYVTYTASIAFTISSFISLRWGVGLRRDEIPLSWTVEAMKATYAVEIFYYMAVFLVKMSILFMYLRISSGLGKGATFYKLTLATMALLLIHFLTTMIVTAVQCIPMSAYWNPIAHFEESEGHCINVTAFFYSTNAFTILTDLVILSLPIPTFWALQMPGRRKVGVLAIFGVGAVSTVASCVRLYAVRKFQGAVMGKGLESAAPINTWSFVEIYLGIFCASVPAMKPLFIRPKSTSSSSSNPNGPWTSGSARWRNPAAPLDTRNNSLNAGDDDVELGNFSEARHQRQQRQSQFATLQSAIMTTSQGSLRNYRTEAQPGSQGTTGSSVLSAAMGREAVMERAGV